MDQYKKRYHKRYIYLGLIILWCLVIFFLSHQNGEETRETSDIITGPINDNINQDWYLHLSMIIRKGAHFSEYFILGILFMSFLMSFQLRQIYQILFASGFCFIYALSDEFHQTFIPGRHGTIIDVSIDVFGSVIGILLFTFLYYRKTKMKALSK